MRGVTAYRVLLSADAVGGVWQYAIELARALAARNVSVVVAVLGPAPSDAQRREAVGILLDVTGLPLDWTAATPAALAEAAHGLAERARRHGADIVHVHAPALVGAADWPVPVMASVHSCLATWWRAVRGGPLPDDFAWRVAATQEGLLRADALAAPTLAFAATVRDIYALQRPIAAIHNGRHRLPGHTHARSRAVLTAGRLWDEGKNVAALDRAAARMEWPVRAAGPTEGPNGARIRLAHVVPVGVLGERELAAEYAAASVFAAPARYEPFGLAVLEAAQAGMALVLSDIATFRELWDGAAIFVDAEDTDAFVAAMRRALDETEDWGRRACMHAQRYDVMRMAAETIALHRSVLPALAAAG